MGDIYIVHTAPVYLDSNIEDILLRSLQSYGQVIVKVSGGYFLSVQETQTIIP